MSCIRIKSRVDKLYKRDLYTSSKIEDIVAQHITEYDMKSAGLSLIKEYSLLPADRIKELESFPKSIMVREIGLIMRDNKEFNKKLSRAFSMMRKQFFKENDLNSENVLSIKKDAVYVIGKTCAHTKFGEVEFVPKNKYTSYHKFGNIEMYYRSSTDTLDIKGISDEKLVDHEKYMIALLKKIFKLIETNEHKALVRLVKDFIMHYKDLDAQLGFYRELNSDSVFTLNQNSNVSDHYLIGLENIDESMIGSINISYNYLNFIVPIVQRYYFTR